jgi:hypothetical protein
MRMRLQEILDRCPPASRPSLSVAAAHYSEQWVEQDKIFKNGILTGEREQRRDALAKALAFYKVIRRLETRYDVEQGLLRLDPVLDAVDYCRNRFVSAENPVEVVTTLEQIIYLRYGGGTQTSLASKLGWLVFGSPVVIYDSLAKDALGIRTSSYQEYYARWRTAFDANAQEIGAAAAPHSKEEWFAERVFDVLLWNVGNQRRNARRGRTAATPAPVPRRGVRRVAPVRPKVPVGDPQHLFDGWTDDQRAIADGLTPLLCSGGLIAYRVKQKGQIRIGVPKKATIAILEPRATGLQFSISLVGRPGLAALAGMPNAATFKIHLRDAALPAHVVQLAGATAVAGAGGTV